MQTTQHIDRRCQVYLHPAACTNPAAVEAIQKHTGLLVIVTTATRLAPAKAKVIACGSEPLGGDAP